MYNSLDVANEFMDLAVQEGATLEPMKLLKLTYIAHGWYLGFKDKALINDSVQAWKYGPVIPVLYDVIRRFGSGNVDPVILSMWKGKGLEKDDSNFIKIIWKNYKKFNGLELSSKTHQTDTPWDKTYDGTFNKVIPNELIKEYYKELIHDQRKSGQ
ncbi:hypothetical protein ASG01_04805 [Chryseobacterium sp. Leaf180]|uniref:Panacea domain-containing protein n=1 Tax=Chryseobacterium sp. Leaf180 TaxID=1736289 RepID=UPI0006FD31B1|nr:type II toxin-antitoxin system antitoxin SocA domain-containing protein [Chryseobacterium sp. Leaf180]KQR95175.1 hypothetical protein ASG01_04805 [Chryseobacterium sp. Leaf180]